MTINRKVMPLLSLRPVCALASGLVLLAAFGLGCANSSDNGAPRGSHSSSPDGSTQVTVEAMLADSQLTVLSVEPVDEDLPATPAASSPNQPSLRWEFRDKADKVLAQGTVGDPRWAQSEFTATGTPDPQSFRVPTAMLRLNVPATAGDLYLYEAAAPSTRSLRPQDEGSSGSTELAHAAVPAPGASTGTDSEVPGLSKIIDHGNCAANVNLLILPEGYTQAELSKFHQDAATIASALEKTSVFSSHWSSINVWIQDIASTDSGITDPKTGATKNTAFKVAFGDDNPIPRRCAVPKGSLPSETSSARQKAERKSNANVIALLLNTAEYSGCAIPSERLITVSLDTSATLVLAHELGHSLFNLADEYTYGTCNMSTAGVAPNVSKDLKNLPWADLVNTTTIPTTDTSNTSLIGAYEGADYCTTGVYRPQATCMMKELGSPFCTVCSRVADRFFADRASKQPTTPEENCTPDAGADATDGDASRRDCFTGGEPCPSDKVCSWNGPDYGYCCKKPFTATKTCFTDAECAPSLICAAGGPPENKFYCVPPGDSQCE